MSGKVKVTLDANDWESLVQAARSASVGKRLRAMDTNDPEVHYQLERAAVHYRELAERAAAITPEMEA